MGRIAQALGFQTRDEVIEGPDDPTPASPAQIAPPARSVSSRNPMSLSMVYRAITIHAIAGKQLSLSLYREDLSALGQDVRLDSTSFVRKPDLGLRRSRFVQRCIIDLASSGNCYWRNYYDEQGRIVNVELLRWPDVTVRRTPEGVLLYNIVGFARDFTEREITHLKLMPTAGSEYGLGPIQAARAEVEGALDLRDYQANWFTESPQPSGVLTSDLALNGKTAKEAKDEFKASGGGKRDVLVLGQGLHYEPIFLSPADALFVENMQFTTTQIARLFGTPSSLMLANVEGSSQTYQNVEQDWLGFIRFGNMDYLTEIEDSITDLLPRGQYVKFNIEALLRTDTKSRYEAHKLGIDAGWLLKSEVRRIENLPPKPGIDKPKPAPAAPAPAPTQEDNNDAAAS